MKFKKIPVVIDAIQWTGENVIELTKFTNGDFFQSKVDEGTTFASIKTLEGVFAVHQWDWVIKGIKGEHYSCKPDIFEKTYEELTTSDKLDLSWNPKWAKENQSLQGNSSEKSSEVCECGGKYHADKYGAESCNECGEVKQKIKED